MSTSLDMIKFQCGAHVCRTDDSRHIGRIVAVHPDMTVAVKWENGWKELVDYRELERIP